MLKKFTVSNYRQFKEPLEFELTAGGYTFNPECVQNDLVKLALIYGENGTGKSSLGWAIFDLVSHLTDNKYKSWTYDCINAYSDTGVVEFEFHFVFFDIFEDMPINVLYKYRKMNDFPYPKIIDETLIVNDIVVIDYKLNSEINSILNGFYTLNDRLLNPEQNLSSVKYLYKNIRIDENNFYDRMFKKFFDFCNKMVHFRGLPVEFSGYTHIGYDSVSNIIGDKILKNDKLKDLERFLSENGLKFNLIEIDRGEGKRIGVKMGDKEFLLFDIASSGTRSLVIFYYWWQEAINNKIPLLFIDEFDCSYHFALSEKIVEKLKELPNTQVILTTHNTNLLSNYLIRPDCGFVIDGKQIKSLNNATNRELREAHNLEKMYQAGEFDDDF